MAPPKRKTTGGRVTAPKATISPSIPSTTTHSVRARAGEVQNSSRYTPPHPEHYDESSRWVPIIMGVLLAGGLLVIMSRYFFWDSNLPTVIGLGLLLAGLFMATKWK